MRRHPVQGPLTTTTLAALAASCFDLCAQAPDFARADEEPRAYSSWRLAPAESAPVGGGGGSQGSEGQDSDAETLAKAAQNPVANLISVPFQNNFNFGIGPNEVTQWNLNVQPVIPIRLSEDWNVITRTILPIIDQPSPAPGIPSAFGLGDLNPTLFLSPAKSGPLIWGAGPAVTFPTATDPLLGHGQYSAGPGVVALTMQGPWVIGALANNQWSYAGWGDEDVNALLVQPFINYNLPHGWYLVTAPIITADWRADSDERWTTPVGGGIGKIQHFGKLPVNVQLSAYYNLERPETSGADWQLRFQFQFLFPK